MTIRNLRRLKESTAPYFLAGVLFLLLTLATGCTGTESTSREGTSSNEAPLLVVTTTSLLSDIVANVAGEAVQVHSLLSPGADPHSFQASASDIRMLEESRIIFLHGAGLEQSLDNILDQSTRSKSVDLSQDIALLEIDGTADPHVWLNPQNVQTYARNIASALAEIDPAHAEHYNANAEAYSARLELLDLWITDQVATIPPDARLLVTNHDSMGYYAMRYGFEVIGVIVPGGSTLSEPSAGALAALSDTLRTTGVSAIFVETTASSNTARQLANEAGVSVIGELYTGTLGPPGSGAETYIAYMQHNTRIIVEALGGTITPP